MTTKSNTDVEEQARELLVKAGAFTAPVPIERVAGHLGVRVEAADLGEDVSGILVVEGDKATIGYNQGQSRVRQRFSVAHEIGHFMLHRGNDKLFIDRQYTAVFRRDQSSSSGEHLQEIQANQFAAALLMPEDLVLREIRNVDFDLGNEESLAELASRFQVSTQAMSFRLARLGMFPLEQII